MEYQQSLRNRETLSENARYPHSHQREASYPVEMHKQHSVRNSSARLNQAISARFLHGEIERPYAVGQKYYIARGFYTSGTRRGQLCVIKWPKHRQVASSHEHPFRLCKYSVRIAISIVDYWNASAIIDQQIFVNLPLVWKLGNDMGSMAGSQVLVEPYIGRFCRWNSNNGWADISIPWGRAMQALSHFSFHATDGKQLLCGLQGGYYFDRAVITDPVVCSITRSFGPSDAGIVGIISFFARHKCNEFCRRSWKRPNYALSRKVLLKASFDNNRLM